MLSRSVSLVVHELLHKSVLVVLLVVPGIRLKIRVFLPGVMSVNTGVHHRASVSQRELSAAIISVMVMTPVMPTKVVDVLHVLENRIIVLLDSSVNMMQRHQTIASV